MAEGFISRKLMSIRWPVWLLWKEIFDIRQMTKKGQLVAILVFQKLIELVEQKHRVTQGLNVQKNALQASQAVERDSWKVAEYISFEEDDLMRIFIELEKLILNNRGRLKDVIPQELKIRVAQIISRAADRMEAVANEIRVEEGEEYRDVMRIINAASAARTNKDRETVMEQIKVFLRRQPGFLNRALMKRECRVLRNDIHKVKVDKNEVEKDLDAIIRIKNRKNLRERDWASLAEYLEKYLNDATNTLQDAFKNAYHALKRDFLMLYLLLSYLVEGGKEAETWVKKNFMPEVPERKFQEELDRIMDNINKHMREIAQAIRIIVDEDETVKKLAIGIKQEAEELAGSRPARARAVAA